MIEWPHRPQYQLDLSAERPDYTRDGWLLTQSTRRSLATADAFMRSDESALVLCGPAGSGKTHLAYILGAIVGSRVIDVAKDGVPTQAASTVTVLDDIDAAPDAKAVLRLVEATKAEGRKLILAGQGSPHSWAKGLRDLETRLQAMARITLDEPDEDLMRGIIAQLFRRRQWRASASVPAYAAPRIKRTFAAAQAFVDAVGAEAIATGRPISLKLARKIADNLSEASPSA